MRKLIIIILICAGAKDLNAQTVTQKIATAYKQFENDPQLKHAISSLYIIDAATGKVVFDKNSQVGLAPASSQKIITAATAFELLGKDYRYKTELGYDGEITKEGFLDGDFYIYGNGDPTLGSWRYGSTKEDSVFRIFAKEIEKKGLNKIAGELKAISIGWESNHFPDGWIWQDIGNYYGAGTSGINWRENQFDIVLESGNKVNVPVTIKSVVSELTQTDFISEITSGPKNSGDKAYIYLPLRSQKSYLRGTIPLGEKKFAISGSMSNPAKALVYKFAKYLSVRNSTTYFVDSYQRYQTIEPLEKTNIFFTHYSPSLDSIIYWFLKKSINLYGEALIKTMAYEKKGFGATDTGISIVKDFWKQKSLDPDEINIYDGSGLSPLNRVTTHAQVEVLKYAKKQNWFRYFYEALPEYNGMKLKSGTISDVKAFCGYHTSKDGKNYILSFIVNNYSGSATTLVNKMYRVLDVLK